LQGKVDLPVNDRTLELQGEVRNLRSQVEDLNSQLYAARAAVTLAPGGAAAARASSSAHAGYDAAAADATSRELQRQHAAMRDTMREVADENRKLREEISSMVGRAARPLRGGLLRRLVEQFGSAS
jgi:septal ring factor EnvC (AmiA/AmiB activator)